MAKRRKRRPVAPTANPKRVEQVQELRRSNATVPIPGKKHLPTQQALKDQKSRL